MVWCHKVRVMVWCHIVRVMTWCHILCGMAWCHILRIDQKKKACHKGIPGHNHSHGIVYDMMW